MHKLSWLATFLNSLIVRVLAVLASLSLIYSYTKEFGLFEIQGNIVSEKYIIIVTIAVIISVGLYGAFDWMFARGSYFLDSAELSRLKSVLSQRIGTKFSFEVIDEKLIDRRHRYALLEREDFLSYEDGNYLSVRRIVGHNNSRLVSGGLIYCESTEYKISFEECEVVAFDTKTKEVLFVEPVTDTGYPLITHAFKIHFPSPIKRGEKFDITYRIFFPNEIRILDPQREIMSISLRRIKFPVGLLKFRVSLDFFPITTKAFERVGSKYYVHQSSRLSVSEYSGTENEIRSFLSNIPTGLKSTITLEVNKPNADMYIVEYIRDNPST